MPLPGRFTLLAALLCAAAFGCRKPSPAPQEAPKAPAPAALPSAPPPERHPSDGAPRIEADAATLLRAAESALQDVHFDYDRSELRAEDRERLRRVADFLRTYPSTRIEIEGHCDERGTEAYNIALGNRRAAAALHYLTALGVAEERLATISYGKERPLCTEAEEACWGRNRRAHFRLNR